MINFLIATLLISLSPAPLDPATPSRRYWIVWNVGQGQWTTLVEAKICRHFDMGGERNPLRRVQVLCRQRENRLLLSHWDWDHVGFALKSHKALPRTCVELSPIGPSSPRKMKILKAYPKCTVAGAKSAPWTPWRELTELENLPPSRNSNDLSHVLFLRDGLLLPGDSPVAQEKIWSVGKELAQVRILLLGHHGSRTSTSEELLGRLPQLKIAVVSARAARYGHPHAKVLRRLRKFRIPLLKTEDWGHLWFELPPSS